MILFLFVIVLVVLLGMQYRKESFRTKKTSMLDSFMNASPMSIVDGIHKRIHPFIPYKKQYFKLKRYLRYR
jgi:hypothetical protein